MNLKDFKEELKQDPAIKKEFETYDLQFEISRMLVEARLIKRLTQSKLAGLINTKQSGIARAERGESLPSLSFLDRIAKALNTQLIVKFKFMMEKNEQIEKSATQNISKNFTSGYNYAPISNLTDRSDSELKEFFSA